MKKRIAIALLFSMFGLLILWMGVDTYYAHTRAKVPDIVNGRIHRINVHGAVAYLTWKEDLLLNMLFYGGILCAVVGGGIWRASERESLRK